MIPRLRLRREFLVRIGGMVLAAALVAGCSSSNTNGTGGSVNHITAQGTSVAGWLSASGASNHSRSATNSFIALGNAGGCTECHGADLLGGISRVSCMDNPSACHHGTVAEWVASGSGTQQHGASAKRGPGSSSMYACRICHGTDFRTDRGSVTCYYLPHAGPAPGPAVAKRRGRQHARECEHGERPGLFRLPCRLPGGKREQPAPAADARGAGHGPRLLQRDDVPQPGGGSA